MPALILVYIRLNNDDVLQFRFNEPHSVHPIREYRTNYSLLAPVWVTRLAAFMRDSNVPASVHQPSRTSHVIWL